MTTKVFFYGHFMSVELLRDSGIEAHNTEPVRLDGWQLRVGARALLTPREGAVVEGVLMDVASADLARLYAQDGVRDYVAGEVSVRRRDGSIVAARCYNLPGSRVEAKQDDGYLVRLIEIGRRAGLSAAYLRSLQARKG